jgi:hypothetical protein
MLEEKKAGTARTPLTDAARSRHLENDTVIRAASSPKLQVLQ